MFVQIIYKLEGNNEIKEKRLDLNGRIFETTDFQLEVLEAITLNIWLTPYKDLEIIEMNLELDILLEESDKFFLNGYQSWSDTKEVSADYKERKVSPMIKPVIKKYKFEQYGDYKFYKYKNKKGVFHSVAYSYIRKNSDDNLYFIGSLNEDESFTFIEFDTNLDKVTLKKDMAGKIIKSKENIFNMLIKSVGSKNPFEEYFGLLGLNKKEEKIARGWTSWYNYYEDITEDIIMKNLENFSSEEIPLEYFQIDDGYQNAVGDWLKINEKFPKGMKYLASQIKSKGYKPGIWLAPFSAEKKSILVKEHPEWILKDEKGEFVYGGSNWSSFYALDIYNKNFRAYLKDVFDTLINDWGYEMFKLDFLYSACLLPRKNKTRAEVMTDGMNLLREIIGDREILACGVPLISAFKRSDYCRIGCDIGLDWDDKFYMKYMHRERISTKNAIKNSIYRYHLDSKAFYNDPDVFLLRDNNLQLNKNQKETLFWVNNLFGTLIFTSDDISEYNEKQKEFYLKSFEIKSKKILEINEDNDFFLIKTLINNEKTDFLINLTEEKKYYGNKTIEPFGTEYFRVEE